MYLSTTLFTKPMCDSITFSLWHRHMFDKPLMQRQDEWKKKTDSIMK